MLRSSVRPLGPSAPVRGHSYPLGTTSPRVPCAPHVTRPTLSPSPYPKRVPASAGAPPSGNESRRGPVVLWLRNVRPKCFTSNPCARRWGARASRALPWSGCGSGEQATTPQSCRYSFQVRTPGGPERVCLTRSHSFRYLWISKHESSCYRGGQGVGVGGTGVGSLPSVGEKLKMERKWGIRLDSFPWVGQALALRQLPVFISG